MSVSCHIEVASVDACFSVAFDCKHGSSQHMAGVVCCDLDIIGKDHGLMQLYSLYLVDAALYHLLAERIDSTFLGNRYLSKILEHQRNDCLGWIGGYDRARVAHCLSEVRQCSTMIQVEISHDDQIDYVGKVNFSNNIIRLRHLLLLLRRLLLVLILSLAINLLSQAHPNPALNILPVLFDEGITTIQKMKIRELLLMDHVNATVKHDISAADFDDDAASANVLACAERDDFDGHYEINNKV